MLIFLCPRMHFINTSALPLCPLQHWWLHQLWLECHIFSLQVSSIKKVQWENKRQAGWDSRSS